ncbi:hypothetical protein H6P81_014146 [Aristolochia fimbriata]|uniref:Uncharacterized protein n=1 Tax=Aristolochia fimbriata TaxID=158543 RepID=A0AAV7EGX2_ARIFI|nr:hypothetical protein H6P81_014146 [Aristolochia fimbriata]
MVKIKGWEGYLRNYATHRPPQEISASIKANQRREESTGFSVYPHSRSVLVLFFPFADGNPRSAEKKEIAGRRPRARMSSQLIATHREKAEVYEGDALCKQKSMELLEELNLPKGLLPLNDLVECGYNRESGFVWLIQKKKCDHYFKKIGRHVAYAPEVTAFVENRKMKKMTGVKSKELLIWITLTEMYIQDPASGQITFKTPTGLSRSFPVSAFEIEEKSDSAQPQAA